MFACYGWGYAITRWSNIRENNDFAYLSVVGIACLIFMGGVLNLVHLAYPAALIILFMSGLIFFAISYAEKAKAWFSTWHDGSLSIPDRLKHMSGYALPIGILTIAVVYYALTLLPVAAYNYADDFYTYIPRPLRMLQTGTLAGNPFDILGTDSLGAHAFLQGFVVLGFPIEYLQGFEAVFSFALAGMLLITIGKKFKLHWAYTIFALVAFIVINPQSVNVSPIYLGSAMILAIILASCQLLDQMEKSDNGATQIIAVVILGLLSAGFIELKNTFPIYALAYFTFYFIASLLISKDKQRILKICGLFMLVTFLALSPWIALYANNIVTALHIALHPTAVTAVNTFNSLQGNIPDLFSSENLRYGGSLLGYGLIVLMLALIGSYSTFKTFGIRIQPTQRGYFLVAAASCVASVITYFFYGAIIPAELTARYSCPVLIATLPFAWQVASMAVSNTSMPGKSLERTGEKMAFIFAMLLLVVILFWDNFIERIERAYHYHMTISFPVIDPDEYLADMRQAFSDKTRREIRVIQNNTLPGEKILVWIPLPFDLDFARNDIYSIMSTSLLNPWLDIPFNGNADDMVRYLKGQGIRYIMWEEGGGNLRNSYRKRLLDKSYVAHRRIAERGLILMKMISSIMSNGSFLYEANGIVLLDLYQVN